MFSIYWVTFPNTLCVCVCLYLYRSTRVHCFAKRLVDNQVNIGINYKSNIFSIILNVIIDTINTILANQCTVTSIIVCNQLPSMVLHLFKISRFYWELDIYNIKHYYQHYQHTWLQATVRQTLIHRWRSPLCWQQIIRNFIHTLYIRDG